MKINKIVISAVLFFGAAGLLCAQNISLDELKKSEKFALSSERLENQKTLSEIRYYEKCGGLQIKEENYKDFLDLVKILSEEKKLLILVDKKHAIDKDTIANIGRSVEVYNGYKMLSKTKMHFEEMRRDAQKDNIKLFPVSAYRDYAYQENLFNRSVRRNGIEHANRYSARPGHSQHHLGTAVDINSVENSFANTKEAAWLAKNAGKYGFSISFPEGQEEVTGFAYEPWHYRYIGKDAVKMQDKYFGGVQQKLLEFLHSCVFKK